MSSQNLHCILPYTYTQVIHSAQLPMPQAYQQNPRDQTQLLPQEMSPQYPYTNNEQTHHFLPTYTISHSAPPYSSQYPGQRHLNNHLSHYALQPAAQSSLPYPVNGSYGQFTQSIFGGGANSSNATIHPAEGPDQSEHNYYSPDNLTPLRNPNNQRTRNRPRNRASCGVGPDAFLELPGYRKKRNTLGTLDCFDSCNRGRVGKRGFVRRGNLVAHLRTCHKQDIPEGAPCWLS